MNTAISVPALRQQLKLARGRWIVFTIGIFKLFKGCLMILLSVAAIALTRADVSDRLREWANDLDVGPYRYLLGQWVGTHILGLTDKRLISIAVGAALYAMLFFTEGMGLLFDRPWAEWMVVFTTAGLIPFEIAEIVAHRRPLMIVMFAGNVAIVFYLIHRVRERLKLTAKIKETRPTQTPPGPGSRDEGSCAPGK